MINEISNPLDLVRKSKNACEIPTFCEREYSQV